MKTVVHTAGSMTLSLAHALLVYENDESAFVTIHDATLKNGRAEIGPGMAASRAALAGLARKIANATAIGGFLPGTLLYMTPRVISWWRPAAPARLFFKQAANLEPGGRKKSPIGDKSGVIPQPHLVFAVTASYWFVWSVAAANQGFRPEPTTPLSRAPHFNVWREGQICTGNVKLPEILTPEVLGDYERAFFSSNFTHPNHPEGLTTHPKGPYAMWSELLAGKHKTFPTRWLTPLKRIFRDGRDEASGAKQVTLEKAIQAIEEAHGHD